MKITTEELRQIIVEELGNVGNAPQNETLAGTAEESILAMDSKVRELHLMLRQAEERGIDTRHPQEYAKAKQAYRQFNMAYQALEGRYALILAGKKFLQKKFAIFIKFSRNLCYINFIHIPAPGIHKENHVQYKQH